MGAPQYISAICKAFHPLTYFYQNFFKCRKRRIFFSGVKLRPERAYG
jgi:hypothetical protein